MINRFKPLSEFGKNILTLMTGSTIAQAIPIAISPILTRIYSPNDFGVFALYLSITSIITVIASGRYELAIILPSKDKDAVNILALSIFITFLVSFISFLIVFIFNSQITELLGNSEISDWLYFIPISVLFSGIYNSFNYWSNRGKKYKRLAWSRIVQSGMTSTTNIGLGLNEIGTGGLVVGQAVGRGAAAFVLSRMVWREDSRLLKSINKLKMLVLLKKYKDFPKLNLPHSLFNIFSAELPVFLISSFFQSTVTGFYSFANRVILAPIRIVTSSYGQVFLQEMSHLRNQKSNEYDFFIKTVSSLLIYSFPVFFIFFVFSPDIFSFVFGENWSISGTYAQILLPMLYLRFTGSIVSSVVIIYNQQKKALFIEIVSTTLRIISLVVGGIFNNVILGLILFSIFSSIVTCYRLVWYYQIIKRSNNEV